MTPSRRNSRWMWSHLGSVRSAAEDGAGGKSRASSAASPSSGGSGQDRPAAAARSRYWRTVLWEI